jgi:ABC-type glutathione transport system ATPase component
MILEVKDLCKAFQKNGEKIDAVSHVSFGINEGECLGLIGESGSGKSTVAGLIAGFHRPDSGDVVFLGNTLSYGQGRFSRDARKEMQMVFQHPVSSFEPHMTVISSVCEGMRYRNSSGLSENELEEKAVNALFRVGIPSEYYSKKCRELSGGECQRVAIARAISGAPRLVILDEVTSALDVSVQAQIIWLLHDLKAQTDISYLFISHDLAVVTGLCDNILVMKEGAIVEAGSSLNILNNPQHTYTKQLLQSALTL